MLRIFSNATESEIACFSAVITNGNSMSHPDAVGSVMGIVTVAGLVASFATAIYGEHIPTIRTHYAHSVSMFVIFAVYHHVYFTGALSMNWPSVLPAFWSNFGWTGGMIYSQSMQASINQLLSSNLGNTTVIGAANLGSSSDGTAGGYQISSIYKRFTDDLFAREPAKFKDILDMISARNESSSLLTKRSLENSSTGFDWYGFPVQPGLPLPGNFTGFAGTLSSEGIPASNAFMTGFLWLLILIAIVIGAITLFKWSLEGTIKAGWVKPHRLTLFREYWIWVTAMAVARILFIAFFMMMVLTLFQFVYKGPAGVTVIAVIVFLLFFVGLLGISGLSCFYQLRYGSFLRTSDRLHFEKTKALGFIPWYDIKRESQREKEENVKPSAGSLPWWKIQYTDVDPQRTDVHHDEEYLKRYGWLYARFRKSKWWFASFWLVYEFVRACFFGGAAGYPISQVFGLLVVEFIGLFAIIKMKPFEGARLNTIIVYLLGLSKILTVALSSAFHPQFGLARITATAIAFIIIVIQGLLLIVLMIFIIVGAISSYMSLTRNRERFHPEAWTNIRTRYFRHIELTARDRPPSPQTLPPPERPKEPHFNVNSIRRLPKIEDQDDKHAGGFDPYGSRISVIAHEPETPGATPRRTSRAVSMHSNISVTNLPFGARPHRQSWSSREFQSFHDSVRSPTSPIGSSSIAMHPLPSTASLRDSYGVRPKSRAPSFGSAVSPLDVRRSRAYTNPNIAGKGKQPAVEEGSDEDINGMRRNDPNEDVIGVAT